MDWTLSRFGGSALNPPSAHTGALLFAMWMRTQGVFAAAQTPVAKTIPQPVYMLSAISVPDAVNG